LKNGALTPVFQPKVSTRDRRVLGVEALSRWNHPTRGMLGAGAFIPLAEERGHMEALTRAVLQMSLKETAAWHAEGLDLSLSVNVSVESLHRTSFPEEVIRMAQGEGLDPGKLVLEVTESRLVMDGTNALSALARFRLAGTGLSIDDYGTGYSSLAQLKRIPFTELKIDRAFVHGAADDPTARAILESSVALAKKLGLKTVAEGAETQEDWDMVSELGCDMVQGYFCARPMPGDEIPAWAGRWESGHA
jgi:EAL domain-containing protein (putative c-di-GMP-specific phosphodiesterase class I)